MILKHFTFFKLTFFQLIYPFFTLFQYFQLLWGMVGISYLLGSFSQVVTICQLVKGKKFNCYFGFHVNLGRLNIGRNQMPATHITPFIYCDQEALPFMNIIHRLY